MSATPIDPTDDISAVARMMGARGGKARAANMTRPERVDAAKKARAVRTKKQLATRLGAGKRKKTKV